MLTATMKLALDSIEQAPGSEPRALPGGKNTIAALMRRGLVEVQGDDENGWHVFLPAHTHAFKTSMHMDGCHTYQTAAQCDCGVAYNHFGERNLKADPYSGVWMDMDTCERCAELMRGARPVNETTIWRPANYVEPV